MKFFLCWLIFANIAIQAKEPVQPEENGQAAEIVDEELPRPEHAKSNSSSNEEVHYDPMESLAIAFHLAELELWDKHFEFSTAPDLVNPQLAKSYSSKRVKGGNVSLSSINNADCQKY